MDILENMRKMLEAGKISKEDIERAFPELRDSEDERIRTRLIALVEAFGQGEYKDEMLNYLEKQKEQKPIFRVGDTMRTWDEAKRGIKDGLPHIISINSTDYLCNNEAIRISNQGDYEFPPMNRKQPAEWSEEDKALFELLHQCVCRCINDDRMIYIERERISKTIIPFIEKLQALRPQPKQESEPLEIKYAEKIYKVYGTKELPGGVVGYIIEDEPGHYDCIIHPDEVLGGGYGIKSNGSPYPTKEANFGQPHWKPSEEQMMHLAAAIEESNNNPVLDSLYHALQKLL